VLLALAQLPGYALAALLVDLIGRRATLALFLALGAAGTYLFAITTAPWQIVASGMLLSFALLGAWGALYTLTPELYPTEVRATGMGWASAMARVAGVIAPTLGGLLLTLSLPLALSVYAVSFLVGAGAALLIREEPRGRRLEDTIVVGAPTP
jgi:putative MFS transporter